MIEGIIVFGIVGLAFFFIGRNIYRRVTGKSSGCGSCSEACRCSLQCSDEITDYSVKK